MPKQEYHKLEPQQKTYVNAFAGALALLRSNRKKPPPEPLKAALDWLPFVDPELYGPITLMNCGKQHVTFQASYDLTLHRYMYSAWAYTKSFLRCLLP